MIEKGNDNYYLEATSNPGGTPYGGAIVGGSYANSRGTASLTVGRWTHLALTLRRRQHSLLRRRFPHRHDAGNGFDRLHGDRAHDRQRPLLRPVLRRSHRRDPHLQHSPHAGPDPERHGDARRGGLSNDGTPPTVTISSPAAGAQVTDIVNVTANANDESGVAGVQFFVDNVASRRRGHDGSLRARPGTVAPSRNGAHTLTASARDPAGNVAVSAPVIVNVTNTNFFTNEILATGFTLPTNIEFLPDGRMLVVELAGTIKVLAAAVHPARPDSVPAAHQHRLGGCAAGDLRHRAGSRLHDQSLLLRLLHPGQSESGSSVAIHGERVAHGNRCRQREGALPGSRRTPTPSTTAARSISATTASSTSRPESTSTPAAAQSLSSPRGKIHRINQDGTIPTDNPFYDGSGPERRLDLGPRASQPVPGLLRRADRQALHRRRRRQRLLDGEGGDRRRRRRRQLRLAELRGNLRSAVHGSHLHLGAQRPRRRGHRRLRLPRQPVPELLPRQLLLRRLHAELDQAPDVRCDRQGQRRLQLRAGSTARSTVPTATSSI